MKTVHIGLGKTATTALQYSVFPELKRLGLVQKYNEDEILPVIDNIASGFGSQAAIAEVSEYFSRNTDILISLEGLVDWEPTGWEAARDRNEKMFGADATILITIREPRSYLRSVYQQMIHQGSIKRPETFFLSEDAYSSTRTRPTSRNLENFNVDAFDLSHLIDLYRSRFHRVIVVPLPSIATLDFLREIFDLSDTQLEWLRASLRRTKRTNVAYSSLAMSLTFIRHSLLKLRKPKLKKSVPRSKPFNELPFTEKLYKFPRRVISRIMRNLRWRALMQNVINAYFPYKKYELDPHIYLGRYLQSNIEWYNDVLKARFGYRVYSDYSPRSIEPR